jgi:molecular chaperone GrpE
MSQDDNMPDELPAEDPFPESGAISEEGAALAEALAREAELKDRLLRAMADLENLRRRAEKEKAESIQYGLTRFAGDLLAVADTLERALSSMSGEARASAGEAVRTVLDGVDLTGKELLRVFEKHGIKRIDPKGAKFDPHLHTAIAQVPAPTVPDGQVVDVAQVGYSIGERLLRPAMVVVGTGGPKSNEPPPEAGQAVDTSA